MRLLIHLDRFLKMLNIYREVSQPETKTNFQHISLDVVDHITNQNTNLNPYRPSNRFTHWPEPPEYGAYAYMQTRQITENDVENYDSRYDYDRKAYLHENIPSALIVVSKLTDKVTGCILSGRKTPVWTNGWAVTRIGSDFYGYEENVDCIVLDRYMPKVGHSQRMVFTIGYQTRHQLWVEPAEKEMSKVCAEYGVETYYDWLHNREGSTVQREHQQQMDVQEMSNELQRLGMQSGYDRYLQLTNNQRNHMLHGNVTLPKIIVNGYALYLQLANNKLTHMVNGNMNTTVAATFLVNAMSSHLAIATILAMSNSKDIYIFDKDAHFEDGKVVHIDGFSLTKFKNNYLFRNKAIWDDAWLMVPYIKEDHRGGKILHKMEEVTFSYHTEDDVPNHIRKYISSKRPSDIEKFEIEIVKMAIGDVKKLSKEFETRIYISDTKNIFDGQEPLLSREGIIYKEILGMAMLQSTLSESLDRGYGKWLCLGLNEQYCNEELIVSILEKNEFFVDTNGWYYCPTEFSNKTTINVAPDDAVYNETVEITTSDQVITSVDSGGTNVFDVTMKSVFDTAGDVSMTIGGMGSTTINHQGVVVGDTDGELKSFDYNLQTTSNEYSSEYSQYGQQASTNEADSDPGQYYDEYEKPVTPELVMHHVTPAVMIVDETTEMGITFKDLVTEPPITTPAVVTTTEAWIGRITAKKIRIMKLPVRRIDAEDRIRMESLKPSSICARVINSGDILMRKKRDKNSEFFSMMKQCKASIEKGEEFDNETIASIDLLGGKTYFYVKNNEIWFRVPKAAIVKDGMEAKVLKRMFRQSLRALLYAAKANKKTHQSRFRRSGYTESAAPTHTANNIINNHYWLAETDDTDKDKAHCMSYTNTRSDLVENIYDAITKTSWWDTRYARYNLVSEYVDLYNIEDSLTHLFGKKSYYEMAASVMGDNAMTTLERVIRHTCIGNYGFHENMDEQDISSHLGNIDDEVKSKVFCDLRSRSKRVPICLVLKIGTPVNYIHKLSQFSGTTIRVVENHHTWHSYSPLVVTTDPHVITVCKYSIVHQMSTREFKLAKESGRMASFRGYANYEQRLRAGNVVMTSDADVISSLRMYKYAIPRDYHGVLGLP